MTKLLDKVNYPSDIKNFSKEELIMLSEEIRHFIINTVSMTGGHFSSNLGTVELAVAIHYCFNAPDDKIIWDVSHQAYAHKILTGRKDKMHTIRKEDGLSGYQSIYESSYDPFGSGHATTSLSAALGYSIDNVNDYIIAIIGDGALSGGMAYEALNIIGSRHKKIIIILNDNDMSISDNSGAIYKGLNRFRTFKSYHSFKNKIKSNLNKRGRKGIMRIKNALKHLAIPTTIFENLGAKYYGPIDGHNIKELIKNIELIKSIDGPVVLHTITKKGKGYKKAERNPSKYHGVSPFDKNLGISKSKKEDFSYVFGKHLLEMAKKDKDIYAITASMPDGTGLTDFSKILPSQFIDVGIAEANAVTMAAAMALNAKKPYICIYSTFLQRAFDQIIHDIAIQKAKVKFIVDRSGLVGNDGKTHQGIFDTSFLTLIPNMHIKAPKDTTELIRILEGTKDYDYPLAIKLPRNSSYIINNDKSDILNQEIIKGDKLTKRLLISYSRMVKILVDVQKEISCDILNFRNLWPIDYSYLDKIFKDYNYIYFYEESAYEGSIAQKLKARYKDLFIKTLPTSFIDHGEYDSQIIKYKLDKKSILYDIKENENAI